MSKSIESRLEKIERTLSIGKKPPKQICVILSFGRFGDDKALIDSLGPYEQWETYKQAIDTDYDLVIFSPDPQKEIEARKRPLTQDEQR